jgi:hypothetical protein
MRFGIDIDDAVHLTQIEDHTGPNRQRTPHQTGPASERHHGDDFRIGKFNDSANLLGGLWSYKASRAMQLGPVVWVNSPFTQGVPGKLVQLRRIDGNPLAPYDPGQFVGNSIHKDLQPKRS